MCLTNKFKVESKEVTAYKIFHIEDGKLYSAFDNFDDCCLPYKLNEKNVPIDGHFYSLANRHDGIAMINEVRYNGEQYWNFKKNLVILEVEIIPEYVGYLRSRNMDNTRTYFSYMSRQLTINTNDNSNFNRCDLKNIYNKA